MNPNLCRKIGAVITLSIIMIGLCSCAGLNKLTFPYFRTSDVSSIQAVIDRMNQLYPDVHLPEDDEFSESVTDADTPKYVYQPIRFLWKKDWIPFVIDRQEYEVRSVEEPEQSDGGALEKETDEKETISQEDALFYSEYSRKFGIDLDGTENKKLILAIDQWMGTPYKWGGCSKKGIDCSCLVKQIYKEVYGIDLHRTSLQIFQKDTKTIKALQDFQEGDIVSFKTTGNRISHIGIYLKDNKFVHTSRRNGVIINDLRQAYFKDRFLAAGRIHLFDNESDIFALNMPAPDKIRNKNQQSNRHIIIKKLHLIQNNS